MFWRWPRLSSSCSGPRDRKGGLSKGSLSRRDRITAPRTGCIEKTTTLAKGMMQGTARPGFYPAVLSHGEGMTKPRAREKRCGVCAFPVPREHRQGMRRSVSREAVRELAGRTRILRAKSVTAREAPRTRSHHRTGARPEPPTASIRARTPTSVSRRASPTSPRAGGNCPTGNGDRSRNTNGYCEDDGARRNTFLYGPPPSIRA